MTDHINLYKRAEEAQRLADDESVLLAAVMAFTQAGRNKGVDLRGAIQAALSSVPSHVALISELVAALRSSAGEIKRLEKCLETSRETLERLRDDLRLDDPGEHYDLVCNTLAKIKEQQS